MRLRDRRRGRSTLPLSPSTRSSDALVAGGRDRGVRHRTECAVARDDPERTDRDVVEREGTVGELRRLCADGRRRASDAKKSSAAANVAGVMPSDSKIWPTTRPTPASTIGISSASGPARVSDTAPHRHCASGRRGGRAPRSRSARARTSVKRARPSRSVWSVGTPALASRRTSAVAGVTPSGSKTRTPKEARAESRTSTRNSAVPSGKLASTLPTTFVTGSVAREPERPGRRGGEAERAGGVGRRGAPGRHAVQETELDGRSGDAAGPVASDHGAFEVAGGALAAARSRDPRRRDRVSRCATPCGR